MINEENAALKLDELIRNGAVHRIAMAAAEEVKGKVDPELEDQTTLFLMMKVVPYFLALLVIRRGIKMRFWKTCVDLMGKDFRRFVPMLRESLNEEKE